jgi:gas vesicle protein
MGKLKSFQAQIQEAIEKGISAVEGQHKNLAEKSFGYVEKLESEVKTYSIKKVHEKHDEAVNSVYETVRNLNKRVNDFATDILAKVEKDVEEVVATEAPATSEAPAPKAKTKTAKATKEAATA